MGRTRASGAKVTSVRRGFHAKTGITFPVRRIQRYLRAHHLINHKARVATTAALYLAAVLEYVVAEVLELAGMAAKHNKKRRINPRWIWLAIKSDEEFSKVLKGSIMPESGNLWGQAIPSPQKASATPTLLAPKKARKKRKHAGQNQPGGGIRAPVTGAVPVGDAVETLGRTLISGVQLSVLKADITSVEADCYVNPTSSSIGFGGQVGSRLSTVGGEQLSLSTQPYLYQVIPDCGAVTTPVKGLKANHIIHVNSPAWNDADSIQKLEATVKNCLDEACRHKFNSVAVPSIGSGGNGFPKHTAAQTILKSIADYFKNKLPTEFDTKKIIFVLFDQQSVNVYRTELGRLVE